MGIRFVIGIVLAALLIAIGLYVINIALRKAKEVEKRIEAETG